MNEYHFDYTNALNAYLEDDEDLFPESELDSNFHLNNQITEFDSSTLIKCSFCNEFGHSLSRCVKACFLGHQLYLKGVEVKQFDLEMGCLGKSIKAWLENLTLMELFVLAIKVKLEKYACTLWERGITDIDRSLLNTREDYIICLGFFFYYFVNTYIKKFDFKVGVFGLGVDKKDESTFFGTSSSFFGTSFFGTSFQGTSFQGTSFQGTSFQGTSFECPVCIESSLPIKEKVQFNCGHSICHTCFNNYLNHFTNSTLTNKPSCSLCRNTIHSAEFVELNYLNDIKKRFIFRDI